MRTTLTLDDDVAAQLERLRKRRKASFRDVVNEALREGLQRLSEAPRERQRYRITPIDTGPCLLPNVDDIAEVLAVAEGEGFK